MFWRFGNGVVGFIVACRQMGKVGNAIAVKVFGLGSQTTRAL